MADRKEEEFYVKRPFLLPKTSKLTEEIIQHFDDIFELASPDEYRNALIEVYHVYISNEYDSLPGNFGEMAGQMHVLIDLFRKIGKEIKEGERNDIEAIRIQ